MADAQPIATPVPARGALNLSGPEPETSTAVLNQLPD